MTEAISLLTQQMIEIKTSNKSLENKLNKVTDELDSMKTNPTKDVTLFGKDHNWFSFQEQPDLSISVWKPSYLGTNKHLILVECNARFKDLVGYPDDILKNNFSASRLINWQMEICPRFREAITKIAHTESVSPLSFDEKQKDAPCDAALLNTITFKTQINVMTGPKFVQITIQPIKDQNDTAVKYFVMQILEAQKP